MSLLPSQAQTRQGYLFQVYIYEKCGPHTSLHPTPPGLRITSSGQDKSNANTHTCMITGTQTLYKI
jgi:hypothetical protein